ncbi:MAG: OB-fold domain-containing protein [Xanthobacteraceae bacterium]|nr:OB-fold domain-containing protein [Xanthobacteraceae bacterium]
MVGTENDTRTMSEIFLGFVKRRELRIARDRDGHFINFLKSLDRPGGDLTWIGATGRATLLSFVVYRRQYHPGFVPPYNVALVALEEGSHLVSTVIASPEKLKIGMTLAASFQKTGRLVFMPAENDHA